MLLKALTSIAVLILAFIQPSYGSALTCKKIYKDRSLSNHTVSTSTALYTSDLKKILKTDGAGLISGEIKWQTFEAVRKFKNTTEFYLQYLNALPPTERALQKRHFISLINKDPIFQKALEILSGKTSRDYHPGEYELRLKLLEELFDVFKILPPDMRPVVGKIPWDQRRAQINRDAEQFTRDFTARFDALFAESSGYKDYAEYERAVRAVDDPNYKLAIQIIDKNQLEIAMRKPENGRFWVPKVGFQNQFVTESSRGYYGPDYRNEVEAGLTGTDVSIYSAKDPEFKPKYTTIFASDEAGVHVDKQSASQYGSDFYYFKKSEIKQRLSFTLSDSFGWTSYENYWGRFIPWERRLLMVPFVIKLLSSNDKLFFPNGKDSKISLLGIDDNIWSSYWEAQIFGRLDLDMVEKFEFQENPPSGEFLRELQKRNIKIYDGRNEKTIPWEPAK